MGLINQLDNHTFEANVSNGTGQVYNLRRHFNRYLPEANLIQKGYNHLV